MQEVKWSGKGEGSLESPFVLENDYSFNIEQPFNINFKSNYVANQPEYSYVKFRNSDTIYSLAYIVTNRDSLMYYQTKNSIKVTMFLTDKVDYLDGPYIVSTFNGLQYVTKQQIFDPDRKDEIGFYRGVWESMVDYQINDLVVYQNDLYTCIRANYSELFIHSEWINLSTGKVIVNDRNPLESDFNYSVGTIWVNSTNFSHYIIVSNEDSIGIWNLGSVKPDNISLAFNKNTELEIKNLTINGGEW